MNIKELRQKKADLAKAALDLNASAGENDFSVEQQTEYDKLKTDIEATNGRIGRAEDQIELEREAAEAEVETKKGIYKSGAAQVKARYEDDPLHGFKDAQDFLMAVMESDISKCIDGRLVPFKAPGRFQATAGSDEQGVYSPAIGGFLVPVSVAPGIMTTDPEMDMLAGRITNLPMASPKVLINARVDKNHSSSVSGGLTVARKDETSAATSSRMSFEQIEMNVHAIFGVAYATEEILSDSPQSFVALLNAGFRDEFASNRMDERLNGSGTGEFLGVLSGNNSAKISITKETGQKAATIVTENIDKMAARCWGYTNAIWLANQTTRPQLRGLSRVVGTGGSVVNYFDISGGQETLDGRPIFFTEHAKALGTVGDLILGNWSQYLYGTYQPLQQAESVHVRFLEHERVFKFWLRDDAMPWWSSVMTPKNGDTLAPWVTLNTRS